MSDLIKRQAAINELVRWGKIPGYSRGERNIIACVIGMLDTLPSEQSEIIRCNDCKYYKAHDYTGYLACHLVLGVKVRRDPDDFCSRGVRREDG